MPLDKEKREKWKRKYYEENKEKLYESTKAWRKANPEKEKAISRRYYLKNRDELRESGRAKYAKNAEKNRRERRERYWKNPEKSRKHHREYVRANQVELQRKRRIYEDKNKEHIKETKKQYRQANPEKGIMYGLQRRARQKEVESTLTEEEWQLILERHFYSCHYCGRKGSKLHREHKIPLSKGGGYTKENIVPACQRCNSRKSTTAYPDFVKSLGNKLQCELF